MNRYPNITSFFIRQSFYCMLWLCTLQSGYAFKKDSTRILFIGNSYTYAGMGESNPEIPFRIKEMGSFYGKPVSTDFVVKGGALLERHWKEGKALKMIETNHYDFVVLQDQSSVTLRNVETFRTYATKFDSVVKKSGAVTVLYMTWGYANRPLMGDTIQYEYNRLGKDLGALVAPCGLAWKIFFQRNPGKELHIADKSHPRREGVYLSATVLYLTMLGKMPTRKLFIIKEEKGMVIDGLLAKNLRYAAEEAILNNKAYGMAQQLNHNPYFQSPSSDINQVIIYGQSLSTGQQTAPSISVKNYKGNLMLGSQVWSNFNNNLDTPVIRFTALVSKPVISSKKTNQEVLADTSINAGNQLNCEPPVIGFVNAAKYQFDQYFPGNTIRKFAATSSGDGGKSIELLMKNCPNREGKWYNHFIKGAEVSKLAADKMNKTINCSAILWMQGEYNYTTAVNQGWQPNTPATKEKAAYKNYFSVLVNDMLTDVKSIYQQAQSPVFITYQCGAQYTRDFDVPIGMAQLELAKKDPRIVLAGPVYPVTDRGGHLCPNGSRWYGEMMAKVYYKTVIKGEKWSPMQPGQISRGTNFLEITFNMPQPPLRIDTLTLQKALQYGFEIKESGKSRKINHVIVTGSHTLRLMVDSVFSEGIVEVNYAGPAAKGNGNICDSDAYTSFETYQELLAGGNTMEEKNRFKPKYEPKDTAGNVIYGKPYPMQNFCCAFYYAIPAGKTSIKCDL